MREHDNKTATKRQKKNQQSIFIMLIGEHTAHYTKIVEIFSEISLRVNRDVPRIAFFVEFSVTYLEIISNIFYFINY